jgi:hypothetical protein
MSGFEDLIWFTTSLMSAGENAASLFFLSLEALITSVSAAILP